MKLRRLIDILYSNYLLGYSRKVIFSILAVSLIVMVPLAYATINDWNTAADSGVQTTEHLRGVSMSSTTNGVAVGASGTVIYTTDGGINWDTAADSGVQTTGTIRGVSMSSTTDGVAVAGVGVIVYTTSPTSESVETTSSGGGNAGKDKTKPTFGVDHKTFFQLIEGGFSFNGIPTDITDNFWTPFEQQSIKVGESNSFEAKVYASEKLRVQEFLFGIPIVGEAHKAELGVEVFYDYTGEIEEIRVIQKTSIIDINSIQIEKIKSKCRADDSDERCVTTQLQMKFLEPLQDSVMAMRAIDFKG
ncbi:hypothetical protein JYT57_00770, partial [Nitrosarchaeum koreense]|nr:hypothetical protein [Nitrosarchaeum koreense]MBN4046191.1 hypothetical protein [Nitrosarchaeum koreense]